MLFVVFVVVVWGTSLLNIFLRWGHIVQEEFPGNGCFCFLLASVPDGPFEVGNLLQWEQLQSFHSVKEPNQTCFRIKPSFSNLLCHQNVPFLHSYQPTPTSPLTHPSSLFQKRPTQHSDNNVYTVISRNSPSSLHHLVVSDE